jgi:hypothetical protein
LILGSGLHLGRPRFRGGAERFVTVKRNAAREVKADLALWPLRYAATGNDVVEVEVHKIVRVVSTIGYALAD